PRPGQGRRPGRERLLRPETDLEGSEDAEQENRPGEGELQHCGPPLAPHRNVAPSMVTAGKRSTAMKGSSTPKADGTTTRLRARRLVSISSRRCARRRSAEIAWTPWATPDP